MGADWEHFAHGMMSGRDRRWRAAALRVALRAVEPAYAGLMRLRNALYDRRGLPVHDLGRPAVSVGNLTAGGTGKTPMVVWLVHQLRRAGHRPAVLLRGYRRAGESISDEAAMLASLLNDAHSRPVPVEPNPDRLAAAARVLTSHPDTDVFVLDDAFQHRRAARAIDIVLVNAAEPWGYGHVHPRGLLREPIAGLRRAGAVVITRASTVTDEQLRHIEQAIRSIHPAVPIYRADHVQTALRHGADCRPIDDLRRTIFFAFAGIADPDAFGRQLQAYGATFVGQRWFPDHHPYRDEDLALLQAEAARLGADMLVTTEKDWPKIARLPPSGALPIWRAQLEVRFRADDAPRLLAQVERALRTVSGPRPL